MSFPAPTVPQHIALEVDGFGTTTCWGIPATQNILGNSAKEDALIAKLNSLGSLTRAFHVMGMETYVVAGAFSAAAKTKLDAFILKCALNGIFAELTFVAECDQSFADAVLDWAATNGLGAQANYAIKDPWWLNDSFVTSNIYTSFTDMLAFIQSNAAAFAGASCGISVYCGATKKDGDAYLDGSVVTGGDEIAQVISNVTVSASGGYVIVEENEANVIPNYTNLRQRTRDMADGNTNMVTPTIFAWGVSLEKTTLNVSCGNSIPNNFAGYYLEGKDLVSPGFSIYPAKSIQDLYTVITDVFAVPPAQVGTTPKTFNAEDHPSITSGAIVDLEVLVVRDYSFLMQIKPLAPPPPPPPTVLIVGTDALCNGSATGTAFAQVTAGGTPPYSYLWSPGGEVTQVITGLVAGVYSVIVTDDNGLIGTDNVIIGEPTAVVVAMTKTDITCNNANNGTMTANPSGGTGPYTYLWSNGETTKTITGLSAGNYDVIVTDANGCTGTGNDSIANPSAITLAAVGVNATSANPVNGRVHAVVAGGNAPYTYAWSTGDTTRYVYNLGAGTYTVTVTDANGCTATDSVTITQPSPTSIYPQLQATADRLICCMAKMAWDLVQSRWEGEKQDKCDQEKFWYVTRLEKIIRNYLPEGMIVNQGLSNEYTRTAAMNCLSLDEIQVLVEQANDVCGPDCGQPAYISQTGQLQVPIIAPSIIENINININEGATEKYEFQTTAGILTYPLAADVETVLTVILGNQPLTNTTPVQYTYIPKVSITFAFDPAGTYDVIVIYNK